MSVVVRRRRRRPSSLPVVRRRRRPSSVIIRRRRRRRHRIIIMMMMVKMIMKHYPRSKILYFCDRTMKYSIPTCSMASTLGVVGRIANDFYFEILGVLMVFGRSPNSFELRGADTFNVYYVIRITFHQHIFFNVSSFIGDIILLSITKLHELFNNWYDHTLR